MVELSELTRDTVRLDESPVGVMGRPCGHGVGIRREVLLARLRGRTRPRYEVSVMSAMVDDPGSGLGPAGKRGVDTAVTHYITLHSPSFCWPILLRVIRSRCRGPFFPERLSSSRRSRALGKSWAVPRVSHRLYSMVRNPLTYQPLSSTISWHLPCSQGHQCPFL